MPRSLGFVPLFVPLRAPRPLVSLYRGSFVALGAELRPVPPCPLCQPARPYLQEGRPLGGSALMGRQILWCWLLCSDEAGSSHDRKY